MQTRPDDGASSRFGRGAPTASRSPAFPIVRWADRTVTFEPGSETAHDPHDAAVVVFARHDDGLVLANIPGRGWTVPSGRMEDGETPEHAARRESYEEIGAELTGLRLIGRFRMWLDDGSEMAAPAFVARVRRYGNLPPHSESAGVQVVRPADLPAVYYQWDPLLEGAFRYAEKCSALTASDAECDEDAN